MPPLERQRCHISKCLKLSWPMLLSLCAFSSHEDNPPSLLNQELPELLPLRPTEFCIELASQLRIVWLFSRKNLVAILVVATGTMIRALPATMTIIAHIQDETKSNRTGGSDREAMEARQDI